MKIPTSLSRLAGKQSLALQQNAPNILFGAGVVGVIGTTVLACRATLKVEELLVQTQTSVSIANRMAEKVIEDGEPEKYTDRDRKKDITLVYVQSSAKLFRLYFPAVALGTASIAALTASHNMLNTRNAGLAAAYATVDKAFDQYRERVVAELGDDKDREFRYGTEKIKVDDPDRPGKKKTIVKANPLGVSGYAKFFDSSSSAWESSPEHNMIFLRGQQTFANDKLILRGYLLLNEVYRALDIPETKAGAQVGWVLNGDGDGYVDFGLYDGDRAAIREFVNGKEGAILLDFNVDGPILSKIDLEEI